MNISIHNELQPGAQLQIFNETGSQLKTMPLEMNVQQINASDLIEGAYILRIINGSQIISDRFIKF